MSYYDAPTLGSEYTMDILYWLKQKERHGLHHCRKQSPQLEKRGQLVEWTCDVADKLGLCTSTLHLAVKLVDLFMDGHDIQDPQLYLVCLGSLLLAAKMEEKDGNVPRCSQLNIFVKNFFPLSDFFSLELVMLNYFHWNICLPTPCYFTSLLIPHSILPTDHHNSGPILSFSKAQAYFQEYVQYFLKVSMTDVSFLDTLPSLLAASVIAAARRAFGLSPQWPDNLELLSGYREEQVGHLTTMLMFHHRLSVNSDEGYNSFSASPTSPTSTRGRGGVHCLWGGKDRQF
eukprot:GFUD01105574.1.p1 GENE.GFUD01105574.1~~GFUD01105574.1.p1  ORF type:complete len:287 (-),score=69.67 GFUD01105574.1:289-1149(-)